MGVSPRRIRPWLAPAIPRCSTSWGAYPTFVYLIPALILFGLEVVPGLDLDHASSPCRHRSAWTYLGVSSTPKPLRRSRTRRSAPRAGELLWKDRATVRHAQHHRRSYPCIILSYLAIGRDRRAGSRGRPGCAGGLRALDTVNIAQGFEAGLAMVLVAIMLGAASASGPAHQVPGAESRCLRSISASMNIIFGPHPGTALDLPERGKEHAAITQKQTGHIVDVAGCLDGHRGRRDLRAHGPVRLGQIELLRCVNRLDKATAAKCWLPTRAARSTSPADAATLQRLRTHGIAMVFQQFALLPWRTVAENIGFGLELRGMHEAERDQVVAEKLELVGLEQWRDRYAASLGGMQQRVGLARAFATDADILLMDEPFSALDPLIRTRLQDDLLDLRRKLRKSSSSSRTIWTRR